MKRKAPTNNPIITCAENWIKHTDELIKMLTKSESSHKSVMYFFQSIVHKQKF